MKKLSLILSFLVCSIASFSQFGWTPQNLGGPKTYVHARGLIGSDSAMVYSTSFADTSVANLGLIKDVPGATIRTVNTLWIRDNTAQFWVEFGAGSLNIDTTESIILRGNGSTGDRLTADLQVSTQSGNIIQIFPDGAYATTQTQIQNFRIGGDVIWETGLTYTVTAATYAIGGIVYTSPETSITLDNADPTDARFDAFVLTTSGTAAAITGTPSADPQHPSYDPETQIPLTFVQVTANMTEPAFCRDSIYFPNNGQTWTGVVSNAGRINLTSTNNPYSVTQDVEFTLARNNDQLRFTKSTVISFSTYSTVVMKIRSKAAWATNSRISVQAFNGLTPLGIPVVIGDGIFGFNSSITNAYQTVAFSISNLGNVGAAATNLLFTVITTGGNTIGLYLDDVQLLGCDGTPIPVTGRFWSQGGDRWGTIGVIGTLDNFPVQTIVNNTNHTQLQTGGTTWMRGSNPGVSFQLGSFASADYFIRRSGTDLITNTAGSYLARFQGTQIYSFISASGHIWNGPAAAQQMILAPTGAFRLNNYGDNTFTGTATRWLAVDVDGNVIEQSPPVSTPLANNGLSVSGGTTTQLGGSALLGNTSILTSAFSLTIPSSNTTASLIVTNSSSGDGIEATSTGGNGVTGTGDNIGVFGTSTDGVGVWGESVDNTGVNAVSTNASAIDAVSSTHTVPAMTLTSQGSTTNSVTNIATYVKSTTGTAANGFGAALRFSLEAASGGASVQSNTLVSKWSDATTATRTSQFLITGVNSATNNDIITFNGNGSITAHDYGDGTFTGTPTFTLQVDADGNIIEGTVGAGTGDVLSAGTPVNNQVAIWTADPTIEGDPNLTFASSTLNIGVAGAATGVLTLSGVTSGTVTIQPASAAGTYTLTLPVDDGTNGDVLSTNGSGVLSWIAAGSVGTVTNTTWTGGIVSIANPTTVPAFTVAGTSGGGVYFSSTSTWASTAALAANAIMIGGGAGAAYSTTTTASGILTFIGTPSSANLRSAVTDESGTGALYFQSGDLGTPTAGTISTGVTLGDVTMNVSGTDATGDIYIRNVSGVLTRLGIGSPGQVLVVNPTATSLQYSTLSGSGTMTSATITQPSAGITVTNSGVAQTTVATWTIALANDLLAIENLATTGIVRRTGTSTWTAGTAVSLTTEVSGTLPVANGGTGFASGFSSGQVLIGTSGGSLARATISGTTNQINVTNGSGSITISHAFNPTVQTLTDGATITWNITNGANSVVTLAGNNRTLSVTNPVAGYTYTIRVIQGSGGSRTISTYPTGTRWAAGTAPTLSTTVGQMDLISFYYDGSNYYGTYSINMQ